MGQSSLASRGDGKRQSALTGSRQKGQDFSLSSRDFSIFPAPPAKEAPIATPTSPMTTGLEVMPHEEPQPIRP